MGRLAAPAVAALLLASHLAQAGEPQRFEPCRAALNVVSRSVRGGAPDAWARLPLYETELYVEPATSKVFGRFQVSFAADATAPEVILVLPSPAEPAGGLPLRATEVFAAVGPGEPAATTFSGDAVLTVTLPRAPHAGERVVVRVTLEGTLPRLQHGTAEDALTAFGSAAEVGAVGRFSTDGVGATLLGLHPVLPPVEDGRFDAVRPGRFGAPPPAQPACQLVSVVVPSGLVASSTGVQVGELPSPDGHVRHNFVAGGARRFGVVFRPKGSLRIERKVDGVTIRVTAEARPVALDLARFGVAALQHLESRYGRYPWTRLEIVTAPVTGALAGLRAPGVVVVNDLLEGRGSAFLALATGQDPSGDLRELAVVHQLAHQWFGELVATPGPEAPVLEELLAHHATFDYARARYGEASAKAMRASLVEPSYKVWRALGSPDGAADRPLPALGGFGAWSALCEGKAPRLLSEVEARIGATRVRRALQGFAKAHRFGLVDRRALEAALVDAAPAAKADAVRGLFVRWLDEAHGDEDVGTGDTFGPFGAGDTPLPPGMSQQTLEEMMEALGRMLGNGP